MQEEIKRACALRGLDPDSIQASRVYEDKVIIIDSEFKSYFVSMAEILRPVNAEQIVSGLPTLLEAGIKPAIVDTLIGGGFKSLADVAEASDADLVALPRIGKALVRRIRAAL